MPQTVAWLVIGTSLTLYYSTRFFIKKKKATGRVISDEEFLAFFENRELPHRKILKERRRIAFALRIPYRELSPQATREELVEQYQLYGDVSYGWGDLEEELADWLGRKPEEVNIPIVADFIVGFITPDE